MPAVTLVSSDFAKKGNRFYFMGAQEECNSCKLQKICFNVEMGRLYEIKSVRPQTHQCALNEDRMSAVSVEAVPMNVAIPGKMVFEGSTITFNSQRCDRVDCTSYRRCNPYGVLDGSKYTVVSLGDELGCPIGRKIVSVEMI